jgi:hypothetical protein
MKNISEVPIGIPTLNWALAIGVAIATRCGIPTTKQIKAILFPGFPPSHLSPFIPFNHSVLNKLDHTREGD